MGETLTVRIDSGLKDRLAEAAKRDDRTLSNFARRVLHQAVATGDTADTGGEGTGE